MKTAESPNWFRNPAPQFRTAAFWFWHTIPTQSQIDQQLWDMHAKGIGTVMIQARPALPIADYLSPMYLAAIADTAAKIKDLGLHMTLYDEYGWMSGHGGGRTVAGADHLRERHLFWTSGVVQGPETTLFLSNIKSTFLDFLGQAGQDWCYEGGGACWSEWSLVVTIVDDAGSGQAINCPARLVPTGQTGCKIILETGDTVAVGTVITAFVSARCATSRMINYLRPEAAERFIEKVYKPLLDATNGVADGFFFDHPYAGFYHWDEQAGDLGNSLLWDDTVFEALDKTSLLAVVKNVGPRTENIRSRFFKVYTDQLHEAFFGTLSRWTTAKSVGFTGHELLTHVGGWGLQDGLVGIDGRSMPGVDYFGLDGFRSTTSVDASGFAPQLSAKLGDSVARANGRSRCMIEQYATGWETGTEGLAGQWGLTAETFRAQSIRHLLFGARQILLHALLVDDGEDGDTTLLLNPRFDFPPGYNFQPWWDDCTEIFSEFSRVSAFLEGGVPLRPVALFYPLDTIRTAGPEPMCGKHFGWWAKALAEGYVGYDILDECNLADLVIPDTCYSTLILPAVTGFASPESIAVIQQFRDAGGRVLITGHPPKQLRNVGNLLCKTVSSADDVSSLVMELPKPTVFAEFASGPTWQSVTRHGDTWRLVVFNDTDQTRDLTLKCGDKIAEISRWHPENGDLSVTPWGMRDGQLCLTLDPQTLLCVTLRCGPASALPAVPPQIAPQKTILLETGWTLSIGEQSPLPVLVDRGWQVQGHPRFSGTGVYHLKIDLPPLAPDLIWQLFLPGLCETATLFVNGNFVGRHIAGAARFDLPHMRGAAEITLSVRNTGANRYYADTPYGTGTAVASGLTQPPVLRAVARHPLGLRDVNLKTTGET